MIRSHKDDTVKYKNHSNLLS